MSQIEKTREPRVVYFVASHVNPEQIARLVRACRSGSSTSRVLLHHDYSVSDLSPGLLDGVDNVDLLHSEGDVGWGAFSMCAMVIRCMSWLVEHRDFDWVVYVSGQDYPIKTPTEIAAELAVCDVDGFLQADLVDDVDFAIGSERYRYAYYDLPKIRGWTKAAGAIQTYGRNRLGRGALPALWVRNEDRHRIGVRRWPFERGFECYRGSSWWTLSKRSILHMLQVVAERPELMEHYRRAGFAPNESFFLTILRNNPELRLPNDHKRFMRWSAPQTGHPDFLSAADVPAMLASDAFFARKLDQNRDPKVLDLIDEALGLTTHPTRTPVGAEL